MLGVSVKARVLTVVDRCVGLAGRWGVDTPGERRDLYKLERPYDPSWKEIAADVHVHDVDKRVMFRGLGVCE